MFNFSKISNGTVLGKTLRFLLAALPGWLTIRVLQGSLRGKKWIKGSGNNGYWLGTYEFENQEAILKNLGKGFYILDIGAHVGFYTLLFSDAVGPDGKVVSFEPSLKNFNVLKRHMVINKCENVRLVNKAVSDISGAGFLFEGESSFTNHLGEKGVGVEITTIDEWCENEGFAPNLIKIDVEGFEPNVLTGGRMTIQKYSPVVAVAYNPGQHKEYTSFFEALDYKCDFIKNHIGHVDMVIAKKK